MKITGGNKAGHFTLDTVGDIHVVRVASELDRETNRHYMLTVLAEDRGTPPRNSSVHIESKSSENNLNTYLSQKYRKAL